MTFSKFVKKVIDDKHLSARRVARAAGLDPSFFSKILSGKRSPPSDEKILRKLARALGADPVYMVFLAGRIPDEFRELFLNENFIVSLRGAAGLPRPAAAGVPAFIRTKKADVVAPPENPRIETPPPPPRGPAAEEISEDLL